MKSFLKSLFSVFAMAVRLREGRVSTAAVVIWSLLLMTQWVVFFLSFPFMTHASVVGDAAILASMGLLVYTAHVLHKKGSPAGFYKNFLLIYVPASIQATFFSFFVGFIVYAPYVLRGVDVDFDDFSTTKSFVIIASHLAFLFFRHVQGMRFLSGLQKDNLFFKGFFSLRAIAYRLRQGRVSTGEFAFWIFLFVLSNIIFICKFIFKSNSMETEDFMLLALSLLYYPYAFYINKQGDGKDYFKRVYLVNYPATFQGILLSIPYSIIVGILSFALESYFDLTKLFDFNDRLSFYFFLLPLMFFMLYRNVKGMRMAAGLDEIKGYGNEALPA